MVFMLNDELLESEDTLVEKFTQICISDRLKYFSRLCRLKMVNEIKLCNIRSKTPTC